MKLFLQRQLILGAALLAVASILGLAAAPAQAFTPYRLLLQAVRSPQSPMAFVADKRLKANLRAALLTADPGTVLSVKAYVGGGHGYLVGWVKDDAQRTKLEDAARQVAGLISLAVYLPAKPTGDAAPSLTAELELKAKLKASLRVAMGGDTPNIAVEVLGSHAVLVGVLGSTAKIQHAGQAARETSGVSGVTSFLTVPLSGDTKRIGILQ
jgi:osmotically-inducible protein OsmY